MFAVMKTGGKQYKVGTGDVIVIEKLSASAGDVVQFDKIMMFGDDKVEIGTPTISGAAIHAEVIEQSKSKKVTSFVKRRRKHSSQRTKGHRQNVTVLRVQKIMLSGAKTSGEQIEVGVTIIGSNPKVVNNLLEKEELANKPIEKLKSVKKPALKEKVKVETKKNQAIKEKVKVASKNKPLAKAETAKDSVAKTEVVKTIKTKAPVDKTASKVGTAKKSATKIKIATKKSTVVKKN